MPKVRFRKFSACVCYDDKRRIPTADDC